MPAWRTWASDRMQVQCHACMCNIMHSCATSCIHVRHHAFMCDIMHICATSCIHVRHQVASMCNVCVHGKQYSCMQDQILHLLARQQTCTHFQRHKIPSAQLHTTIPAHACSIIVIVPLCASPNLHRCGALGRISALPTPSVVPHSDEGTLVFDASEWTGSWGPTQVRS